LPSQIKFFGDLAPAACESLERIARPNVESLGKPYRVERLKFPSEQTGGDYTNEEFAGLLEIKRAASPFAQEGLEERFTFPAELGRIEREELDERRRVLAGAKEFVCDLVEIG
jgi:hypothetical protein